MKRFLVLLVVLAGGVAAAAFTVPSNAATVNGTSISQQDLNSDVNAIAHSTYYQCYLNSQEYLSSEGSQELFRRSETEPGGTRCLVAMETRRRERAPLPCRSRPREGAPRLRTSARRGARDRPMASRENAGHDPTPLQIQALASVTDKEVPGMILASPSFQRY